MKSFRKQLTNSRLSAVAIAITLAFSNQAVVAQESTDTPETGETEIISVKGIRGSLLRAQDIKRSADSVVDAISAEDIGKFPDQNLAESLQRITGVSISRARGEGSRVTVRGLGTGFNLTTLNGNTTTSASSDVNGNGGRDFAFDVLPSELISGVEVVKSPTADLNEGSLGALVNIQTAKPLSTPGLKLAASASGTYSVLPEETDPKVSGLFSNTFADDTFGILVAASYTERTIRQDSFISNGYRPISEALAQEAGLEGTPFSTTTLGLGHLLNTRERLGVASSIQYKPSDNLLFTFDGFYSELRETGNAVTVLANAINGGENFRADVIDNVIVRASADTHASAAAQLLVTNGNDNFVFPGNNDFSTYSLKGEWSGDNLDIDATVYTSNSESFYDFERYLARFPRNAFNYDISEIGEFPTLEFEDVDFTDPNTFTIPNFLAVPVSGEEEEIGGQIDFDLSLNSDTFYLLEFGVQHKQRSRTQNRDQAFVGTNNVTFPSDLNFRTVPSDFAFGSNVLPVGVVFADVDDVRDALLPDGLPPAERLDGFFYTIDEDVTAAYVKTNFEFEATPDIPITGNVGVRWVRTEQTSNGLSQELIGVDDVNELPIFSDDTRSVSEDNNYDDVLFSLNLKAELNDDVQMRLSAANVIARPPVSRLAPSFTAINVNAGTVSRGNPNLDPFRANQLDITVEWYFNDVGSLTSGIFFKDLETLVVVEGELEEIADGIIFNATQPRNIDGGIVRGLEVAFQNQFTSLPGAWSGIGVIANYTYVDSNINIENDFVPEGIGLEGLSEHNLNLVAFYEYGGWSARLAYNYRTDFLERTVGLSNNPEFVDAFGQLDGQISYDFNDSLSLFIEAIDITSNTLFRFSNNDERQLRALTQTGARYSFGVRYTF